VRQRAREQALRDSLEAQETRLEALERRLEEEISASGRRLGATAAALGRRVDRIERLAERATALAQPAPPDGILPPGSRVIVRGGVDGSSRAICSIGTGRYRELLSIASASFAAYARRWNWDLVLSTEDLSDGRPAAWGKVRLVRELLDAYKWVLYIDADACFVDTEVDLMASVESGKDLYLVEHRWGDPPQATANSGVFLVRSGDWGRSLLEAMWAKEELIHHRWWENAALLELLGYDLEPAGPARETSWMDRVKFLDLAWNSVRADPAPRPIIDHHGTGLPIRRLRELLLDDAARLRRGPDRGVEALGDVWKRTQLPDALNALGLRGRAAEIGVHNGEFSELLLSRWEGEQLLSVDPWNPAGRSGEADEHERLHAEAQGRLAAFGPRSWIWRVSSEDAAPQVEDASLDFAYIDAQGDEASVERDLKLWWPKVRPGGVLAGYAYLDGELPTGTLGVKMAVDRFLSAERLPVHATDGDWPWPSWLVRKPG